jgi:hypothetical protein
MKMFDKEKQTRLWGNHIDPEVSAESYLSSDNAEVSQWQRRMSESCNKWIGTPSIYTAATWQTAI